jgi:hypothetical protein
MMNTENTVSSPSVTHTPATMDSRRRFFGTLTLEQCLVLQLSNVLNETQQATMKAIVECLVRELML